MLNSNDFVLFFSEQEMNGNLHGDNWVCKTYSPHAVPSPSILKVKAAQDISPPPSKVVLIVLNFK